MSSSYNKTALDIIINAISEIILIPLFFIRMPVLTRNLSIEEYGIWSLIFTTCSLSLTFTSLGLGGAMSRFLPSISEKKDLEESFYSVLFIKLIMSFIIALFFLLFSSYLANSFFDGRIELVNITALFIVLTTVHPVYTRLFKILRRIKPLSLMKVIEGYGTILLYAILFFLGHGLIAILYAAVTIKVIFIFKKFESNVINLVL